MKFCIIEDCSVSVNNCKQCIYQNKCDYPWVYTLWDVYDETTLTPLIPSWVKQQFQNQHVVTITGKYDFCVFDVPKRKDYLKIQDIAVDERYQGSGLGKKLVEELMKMYDKDIITKCVKGTSAEEFWKHLGVKIDEEQSRVRNVCTYFIENKHKKLVKEVLFQ